MEIIDIATIQPAGREVATFHGFEHGAGISFFVVAFGKGNGPRTHRHPYEETFILLEGEVALTAAGVTRTVGPGSIAVIPAGTWHAFTVSSEAPVRMVNVHPVPRMITEWAE